MIESVLRVKKMEDNKLPANSDSEAKIHDFTGFDLKAIEKYKEDGLPGIASLDDPTIIRMMELYLGGKTYREISQVTNKPKAMILYISDKFGWYIKKAEYLRDLEETMIQRTLEAKLVGQDFLLQLKSFFEKKIGHNINNYLRTGDAKFAGDIDLKEVDKYIKTFETLEKLTEVKARGSKSDKGAAPAVGLNLGDGVTIERIGDNKVEVTPKQKTVGDMLKQFADLRRQENDKKENNLKKEKGETNE
jgi:hypothetical protein